MNNTPTPETDALIRSKDGFGATNYEWRDHSRRLERERDEARAERDILRLNSLGTIQLNIPVTTDYLLENETK